MPFKRHMVNNGCLLTGQLLHGNRQPITDSLQLVPEHGGVYKGTIYSGERIFVTPAQDGTFSVTLAPSIVMGIWTLKAPTGEEYQLNIPDKASARLDETVVS
jgi:hypothetical protein